MRSGATTAPDQEYRQVDPRPHNVVSDFTIKLGVGMQFPQYVLGLDLQGRLYKQDQDIDFFYPPRRQLFRAVYDRTGQLLHPLFTEQREFQHRL